MTHMLKITDRHGHSMTLPVTVEEAIAFERGGEKKLFLFRTDATLPVDGYWEWLPKEAFDVSPGPPGRRPSP